MPWKKSRYPKNWDAIARAIKQKSGWRCAICKESFAEVQLELPALKSKKRNGLSVHHIVENPQNNAEINLIALCFVCHLKIEHEARLHKEMAGKQAEMFPEYSYHSQMVALKKENECQKTS